MLNLMRDTIKYSKWILLFIIVSFILFFGPGSFDSCSGRRGSARAGDTSWVARVDGKDIDPAAWRSENYLLEQNYRRRLGQLWDQFRKNVNIKRQSAEQLIDRMLVEKDARRLGLGVSDQELSALITSMPDFQQPGGGFIGKEAYERIFSTGQVQGFASAEQFEESMRERLLLTKWRDVIGASVVVTKPQVEQEFRRRHEKATLEYVALPVTPAAAGTPGDAELESFYRAHQAEFGKGEGRHIEYVDFSDPSSVKVNVTDAEISAYYDQHKQEFEQPEQRRARHILVKVAPDATPAQVDAAKQKAEELSKQAKGGADFAKLAQQNSDDPGSKANGGDLGAFGKGQMVPEFDQAVFSMKPGDVSDPVRTQYGFHVIKLEQVIPAGQQPLSAVKEQVRGQLAFPKREAAAQQAAKEFRAKVKNADDFKKVADELKIPVKDPGVVLQNEPLPGLGPAPAMLDAAFALGKGQVSDVVTTQRGPAVVAVLDIVPNYTPPLAARRDRVLQMYRQERGKDEAKARLQGAIAKAGGDLAKAAKELGVEVKKTEQGYTRGEGLPGAGSDASLDQAAFGTPVGGTSQVVATPQAAVVVRVVNREQPNMSDLAKEEADIREQLRQPLVDDLVQAKVTALRKASKIELNQEVLKNEA